MVGYKRNVYGKVGEECLRYERNVYGKVGEECLW